MVLKISENLTIDNLRQYPAETVEKLRALLAVGALAQADPRRQNFYELENGSRVFYVHIAPRGGKVMLLGTWLRDDSEASARAAD